MIPIEKCTSPYWVSCARSARQDLNVWTFDFKIIIFSNEFLLSVPRLVILLTPITHCTSSWTWMREGQKLRRWKGSLSMMWWVSTGEFRPFLSHKTCVSTKHSFPTTLAALLTVSSLTPPLTVPCAHHHHFNKRPSITTDSHSGKPRRVENRPKRLPSSFGPYVCLFFWFNYVLMYFIACNYV